MGVGAAVKQILVKYPQALGLGLVCPQAPALEVRSCRPLQCRGDKQNVWCLWLPSPTPQKHREGVPISLAIPTLPIKGREKEGSCERLTFPLQPNSQPAEPAVQMPTQSIVGKF